VPGRSYRTVHGHAGCGVEIRDHRDSTSALVKSLYTVICLRDTDEGYGPIDMISLPSF
jgi:hypothetical protein